MSLTAETTRSDETLIRDLTDNPMANGMALGCAACPNNDPCGGLCVGAPLFTCFDLCCGDPGNCTSMCRKRAEDYVEQFHEINGFDIHNTPRAPRVASTMAQDIVPLIYHGSKRAALLSGAAFALRLSDLINFKKGTLRFSTRKALAEAYQIPHEASIILSGVHKDHRIEPIWSLGEQRKVIIDALVHLGVSLVTIPNFSVFLDRPRTDDLHSINRIAILFSEFQSAGLPCALHPNGRTIADMENWARFVAERNEVEILSYEFGTGTARKGRRQFHLEALARIASAAGRDIDIILRGDPSVIPFLRNHYRRVIYVETTAFMKAIKRQAAVRTGNDGLSWRSDKTPTDATVDHLVAHNLEERIGILRAQYYGERNVLPKAA